MVVNLQIISLLEGNGERYYHYQVAVAFLIFSNMGILTKETLAHMYLNEKKPMWQIAQECNIAVGTVYNYIHKFGIQARPPHKGYLGHHHSEQTKKIISEKNKDKIVSVDTRAKISKARTGKIYNPSAYGGHIKKHCRGYIRVYVPNHPYATKDGYVFEHILVYERANNCYVDRNKYVVHHINGIKTDNRIENLQLMTKHDHMSYHAKQRNQKRRNKNAQ